MNIDRLAHNDWYCTTFRMFKMCTARCRTRVLTAWLRPIARHNTIMSRHAAVQSHGSSLSHIERDCLLIAIMSHRYSCRARGRRLSTTRWVETS